MEGSRRDNAEGQRRKRRGENRNRKMKIGKDEKNGEEEGRRERREGEGGRGRERRGGGREDEERMGRAIRKEERGEVRSTAIKLQHLCHSDLIHVPIYFLSALKHTQNKLTSISFLQQTSSHPLPLTTLPSPPSLLPPSSLLSLSFLSHTCRHTCSFLLQLRSVLLQSGAQHGENTDFPEDVLVHVVEADQLQQKVEREC